MSATDDRQRIQDLMLAYAAAVDDNDMAAYRDCFDDNVEIVGFGESVIHGADQWVASVSSQLDAFTATQHLLSPPLATVAGDRASARTDVQALHFLKTPAGGTFTLVGDLSDRFHPNPKHLENRATRVAGSRHPSAPLIERCRH